MADQRRVYLSAVSFFSVILLILSNSQAETTNGTANTLIRNTCSETKYPRICTSVLTSDNRSINADFTGLCKIAVNISAVKADQILSESNKLINNQTDYVSWGKVSACRSQYQLTCKKMAEEGVPAVERGDYEAAHGVVGLVNEAAAGCNELGVNELTRTNTLLFELTVDTMMMLRSLF